MPVNQHGTRYFAYAEGRKLGNLIKANIVEYVGQKNGHRYIFFEDRRNQAKYIHGLFIMLEIECEFVNVGSRAVVQLLHEDQDHNVLKLHKLLFDLEMEANDAR